MLNLFCHCVQKLFLLKIQLKIKVSHSQTCASDCLAAFLENPILHVYTTTRPCVPKVRTSGRG